MMKTLKNTLLTLTIASTMTLVACSSERNTQTRQRLDQTLQVASGTLNQINKSTAQIKEENIAETFALNLAYNLNHGQPAVYPYPVGIASQENGSFDGFKDANSNGVQDKDDNKIFTLEVDTEGKRLLASAEGTTSGRGFSGSGLLMGMFLGNMLSRQRASGVSPASMRSRTTTPRPSARSRSGSGSFSRGK